MRVKIEWKGGMGFEGTAGGEKRKAFMDAVPEFGGNGEGPNPKQLFLQSIAGCSAMDVVSILEKMRAGTPDSFSIEISGKLTEDHPKVFSSIEMIYRVEGSVDEAKLLRAVDLSQEKYCGLSNMVKKACDLSYSVFLNDLRIEL